MRFKVKCKIFFLFILISSLNAFGSSRDHLSFLSGKFPYGLLSDDYGILSLSDLAINSCHVEPKLFDPTSSEAYPYEYWKCFENKNISFACDSNGIADKYEGVMGLIIITVKNDNLIDTYLEHRLWPIKQCKSFNKDAKTLLKGVKHVCFSGEFISQEVNSKGKKEMTWNFERIKIRKGCEGRGCDAAQELKRNQCPN
jgi:hypothetical protein